MTDQARALRLSAAERPAYPALPPTRETEAIVVGSGKGGAGKSFAALSLAAAFARAGRRTLLVDGDLNLGNQHVLLGVRPVVAPEALLEPTVAPQELVVPVTDHLWLLPTASGAEAFEGLSGADRARLQRRISTLYPEYDLVVVDAAAGLDGALRCASLRASRLLMVTTPEPTALTSAYALIKLVHGRLPRLPIELVVNRTLDAHDGTVAADRLDEACQRFLGRRLRYLGAIPEDPAMRQTLREPAALLAPAEGSAAQVALDGVASRLLADLPTLPREDGASA
jgi:flagellar biosynthesis protein FlhG